MAIKNAAQDFPSLVASGAGAIVAWPVGAGPPVNRSIMAAVAFRATPLIAFAGKPRVRHGRLRVRIAASQPVTVTVRVGKAKVRRRVSGTQTLTQRAPKRSTRVVATVPGGDEIVLEASPSGSRSDRSGESPRSRPRRR